MEMDRNVAQDPPWDRLVLSAPLAPCHACFAINGLMMGRRRPEGEWRSTQGDNATMYYTSSEKLENRNAYTYVRSVITFVDEIQIMEPV